MSPPGPAGPMPQPSASSPDRATPSGRNVSHLLERLPPALLADRLEVSDLYGENGREFFLGFGAKWSIPWRYLVRSVGEFGDGVLLVGVDVDQLPAVADAWGVEVLPTVVHIQGGYEKWRRSGAVSAGELAAATSGVSTERRGMRRRR